MVFDQPRDVSRDRGGAGFDAAMIGLDDRRGGDRFAGRIVEMQHNVVMKRSLISLQGQGVVAALIDDLLGDGALAIERVGGHDRFSLSISNSFGTAVISFDFASVAICASTRRCSQPQAETMCNGDLPLARSNERRRTLPSIATTPSHCSEKLAMNR